MRELIIDYSANSVLQECARKFKHSYIDNLVLPEPNVPMYAGQVMAEALCELHTVQKERWKRGKDEHDTVHQAVCEVLEQSWGEFQTPPGSKHSYLTLGHLESTLWYYIRDRDPFQVEPISESGKILAERATFFEWPAFRNGALELLCIGGKPDIPARVSGEAVIVDWKCSTQYITNFWAKKFSVVGHQLRTYIAMLRHAYGIEVKAAYVDGVHIGAKAASGDEAWKNLESQRSKLFGPFYFDAQLLQETWEWYYAGQEQRRLYESLNYWPQNERACQNFGGCQFQTLCSASPRVRRAREMSEFEVRRPTGALLSGADGGE